MPRASREQQEKRIRWVVEHYFELGDDHEAMLRALKKDLKIRVGSRSLRNYLTEARRRIMSEGLFDKDKRALKLQLDQALTRLQGIIDRAAEEEKRILDRMKELDIELSSMEPETWSKIKDLRYQQINTEKAIMSMLQKAGITAERAEIDISLKAEEFVLLGQAHYMMAYDLIPPDLRELFNARCEMLENIELSKLREIVEGRAPLPGRGAQENEKDEEEADSGKTGDDSREE